MTITRIHLHTTTDPTGRAFVDMDSDDLAAATVLQLLGQPTVTMVTVEKDVQPDAPLVGYRWLPCQCGDGACTLGTLEDPQGHAVEYGNTMANSISLLSLPGRHVCSAGTVR